MSLWTSPLPFLNGDLNENVTMDVFEGLKEMRPNLFNNKARGSEKDSKWILELAKPLYGLKQSPRMWHQKLHSVMIDMGFKLVQCDNSIWVYKKEDTRIIIPVYVDDMTIACKRKQDYLFVKNELAKHFKLHDLEPTSFLLGVHIQRDRAHHTLVKWHNLKQGTHCRDGVSVMILSNEKYT